MISIIVMGRERSISGFANVDRAKIAPEEYIGYLERVNKIEAIRRYKQQMFQLLDFHPQEQVLDVGCGTGEDMRRILDQVEVRKVVGVDNSRIMIKNAIAATAKDLLKSGYVQYCLDDAHRLGFRDNSFDVCYSDRTFQHLENPRQALQEMVRVTKPQGRIVVVDPDWGSLQMLGVTPEIFDVARKVYLSIIRNPYIGKELHNLFLEEGMTNADFYRSPIVLANFSDIQDVLWLDSSIKKAADVDIIPKTNAELYLQELRKVDTLEASLDLFIVRGSKLENISKPTH